MWKEWRGSKIQEEWGPECLDRFELFHLNRLTAHEIELLKEYRKREDYLNGIDLLKRAWFRAMEKEGYNIFSEESDDAFVYGITYADKIQLKEETK